MVGWHHQLNGHEFEQILGDGVLQESLESCSPRGHKELDSTDWWNSDNNEAREKSSPRLKTEGDVGGTGRGGRIASPTQWTWI